MKPRGRPMSGVSRQLLLLARAAGVDLRQASLVMHNICSNISARLAWLEHWGYLTSRKAPGHLKRYFLSDDAAKADAWLQAMTAQAVADAEAALDARRDRWARRHKKALPQQAGGVAGPGEGVAPQPMQEVPAAATPTTAPVLAGRRGAAPPPWQGETFSSLGVGRYLAPGADA